jgi:hypothetical protein
MGAPITPALVIAAYIAVQKGQAFPLKALPFKAFSFKAVPVHAVAASLFTAMRRTMRLTVRFLATRLQGATLSTTTAAAARAFRDLCSLI